MPYQVGVTIRAEVSPDQLPPLRKWLADTGRKGLTEPPFDFAHLRGVHFARLYLLDEVADLDGRPIPAGLVFMSEVDAPLRRHLAQLIDVAGDGIDQAFAHCAGYPGPGARRRTRIAWLRRHLVPASAYYVNTVGRGLDQIRQEAKLRDALEDRLDQGDWTGRAAAGVRQDLQDYVAGRGDLSWAWRPPPEPPLLFRIREAVHKAAMPLLLLLLMPVLLAILPLWLVALRMSELAHQPEIKRPAQRQLAKLQAWEDFETQNPYAVIGFIKPGRLHVLTMRAVQLATSYGARHLFTHGSLAGVKTIHFARWVPLDGWRRMTFASNYDGAVEAYNDDFINEIWWGLNAVFGSAVGYPPTRWLLWGGARLEQPFKYTLRNHQVPVPAWYTAYPALSADNIANNARIRAGLPGEMTPVQAEQWLSLL
ncbi:MAG: hypothetical protein QOG05_5591 [Streptosporangiaceae bacterium]|jgi:hypothetical protein|nr:hypothetical protein [Streptosporangiaceae bacterium]